MKICILDAATLGKDIEVHPIEECGELVIYDTTQPQEVKERVRDVDVIITNKVILNEENLQGATKLKLIALTATGYNNIDIDYAKKAGIGVANVAGYSTKSVAQHTFAMLLYMLEHLRDYDEYVKSKCYIASETFAFIAWPFHEIANKTIGIIGMGAIGKEVAKIAEAFGAHIIYYSTSGKNNMSSYKRVDLSTLLTESDIVTIHAPLNDQTRNLIGYNELAQMKKTAVLLNLGRGCIVVEADLAKALNENLIAAAGLDVLEQEPIDKNNPLFTVEDKSKLLITPHTGWASIEARKTLIAEIVKNIEAFFNNEVRNRVV